MASVVAHVAQRDADACARCVHNGCRVLDSGLAPGFFGVARLHESSRLLLCIVAQAVKWKVDKAELDDVLLQRMFVVPAFEVCLSARGRRGIAAQSCVGE